MILLVAVLVLAQATPPAERAAGVALVSGVVSYSGINPTLAPPRTWDPACPEDAVPVHPFVMGKNGTLADVLVRIRPASDAAHRNSVRDALLDTDVTLTLQRCQLSRRVIGLLAGQTLVFENHDDTLHSLRATVGTAKLFTRALPAKSKTELIAEATPGSTIELRCEVHAHEASTILVQQHPYFAVTRDDGVFEIDFVPEGTHVLEAYHPHLGWKQTELRVAKGKVRPSPAHIEFRTADAAKR